MRFSASVLFISFWALASLVLGGCFPSPQSQSDEEKEPHFLEGKARVNTLDYEGAVECFEKALEANPQSAAAHFELAWLFDEKRPDPSAAIYHYDRYLKLRPNPGNLEMVNQRVLSCKQELARSVSLGPVTEKVQKDLDQLTQDNKRLGEENKKLHQDLEKWVAYATSLQNLTNRAVQPERSSVGTGLVNTAATTHVEASPTNLARSSTNFAKAARSHIVRPGDTPTSIARKYGLKLETLMSANPRLDPRRLQVGQTLVIPGA